MSGLKHQPATPLPWKAPATRARRLINNAAYIVHAANAYPKLVATLNLAYARLSDKQAREEIGALLHELGEAS